jgi:2,3-bisphosphoglycerate-independent phosphoglycerate mutase
MKAFLFICDGMADRPLRELGRRTPLEVARTPNMDELTAKGINGSMDPIGPGVRAGSDTSHLAILGYDPYEIYTGRGPFEASGFGLDLKPGDIAFRCNFALVDDNLVVKDRRAGRIKDTKDLAEIVNKIKLPGVEIIFKSLGYRGALVFRGEGLDHRISDSDPHIPGRKVEKVVPLQNKREAKYTARLVNEFSKKVKDALKGKPANMLLLRGCGKSPDLEPLKEKYGIKGACIATTAIIKGIARLAGMEVLKAKIDYRARSKQALEKIKEVDLFLMNIKEADEAGHDNQPSEKIKIIEKMDEAVGEFMDFSEENYFCLLADHTTPCTFGDHTGDPVPVTICGPEVRPDDLKKFDERSCAKGGLGKILGKDLMPIILNLMNKSEKFGA